MIIEHIGIQVDDPVAFSDWYCKNLGFTLIRKLNNEADAHFISAGNTMLEVYANNTVTTPDYAAMSPLLLHLAFKSEDVDADHDRLIAAGATEFEPKGSTPAGDELWMMRDPWGLAIQLCKRAVPMM